MLRVPQTFVLTANTINSIFIFYVRFLQLPGLYENVTVLQLSGKIGIEPLVVHAVNNLYFRTDYFSTS